MKQLLFILIGLFLLTAYPVFGQEFVGVHADSIKQLMRTTHNDLSLNTSSINKYYNYLKYEDRIGSRTFLIFLDEEDICTFYKEIYDYSFHKKVIKDLNNHYVNIGDTLWTDEVGNGILSKKLQKNEWFFSVTTRVEASKDNGIME
ncbi:MAG: hypothetical protein U9N53_00065 [Bacteroidota bacterium]|nr:hypothetical protein [Bacteroidota bacterium]